tara:strand:+ start:404 stop:943 length:540 start_codon:yes stop_codon:yes gene_type:complete
MKKLFLQYLAVLTLFGFFGIANANVIYNYSFENQDGPFVGTVSGTIELPDGDGVFSAINITLDALVALGYSSTTSISDFVQIDENMFTVSGGAVNAAGSNFFGIFAGFNNAFGLNATAFGASGSSFLDAASGGFLGSTGVLDLDSSSLAFTAVNVSEPATLFLVLLSLGGLLRYRRSVV